MGASMKLRRRLYTAMVAVVAIIAAPTYAVAAKADVFGPYSSDSGPFADNYIHTWCEGHANYIPIWRDSMQDAMDYLDLQTNMTTGWPEHCDINTDIWYDVYDSSVLGYNVRGLSFCRIALTSEGVCGSALLAMNSDLLNTYMDRRKTSCHEIGHTVGLAHSSQLTSTSDCMISGNYTFTFLNSHHKDHINSRY